ncbi:MAG: penicillin-binding protein activator [Pseudomonadota bacterium]
MKATAPILHVTVALLVLGILNGCQRSVPARTAPAAEPTAQAERLVQNRDYAAAAAQFESLAASRSGNERTLLLLKAAENYVRARQPNDAERTLGKVVRPGDPQLGLHYRVVEAELRLAQGDPQTAITSLGASPRNNPDRGITARYYLTLANAYRLVRTPVEEADARMRLDATLDDATERRRNQQHILLLVQQLSAEQKESLGAYGQRDVYGWLALGDALAMAGTDADLRHTQYLDWRLRFPNHPALADLGSGDPAGFDLLSLNPEAVHVGVLLPLSGTYEAASNALSEGMMSAYYGFAEEGRPTLRFYDTHAGGGAVDAYNVAVAEGAEVVIGPLTKPAVDQIKSQGYFQVPVVALNRTDTLSTAGGLVEFALSPEDEARQMADYAARQGYLRAAVLVVSGGSGERYRASFVDHWQRLGGFVVSEQEIDPAAHHFAAPIKSLGASDPDFVVIVASAQKSRQLRTQVQFFASPTLPVFLPSKVVRNPGNPPENLDLDGVQVPGMPWMTAVASADNAAPPLEAGSGPGNSLQTLATTISNGNTKYASLYAMGYDALILATHFSRLQSDMGARIPGATGQLWVDDSGAVRREPLWITFKKGRPEVLPGATPFSLTPDSPLWR